MGVKLSEFASRLIVERKLIRKNKGPSIVPLMIIRFIDYKPRDPDDYYSVRPNHPVLLITACQRTGVVFSNHDLKKLYSGTGYVGYSDWWNRSEIISIRPPRAMSTNRLLEIYVEVSEVDNREEQRLTW